MLCGVVVVCRYQRMSGFVVVLVVGVVCFVCVADVKLVLVGCSCVNRRRCVVGLWLFVVVVRGCSLSMCVVGCLVFGVVYD